jgi:two-component system cell cycle sensor histidine kinase PleC
MARQNRSGQSSDATIDPQTMDWFRKEACVSFDAAGNCLTLSSNWQKLTGYAPEKCLGKRFIPLIRKTDQRKFQNFLAAPSADKKIQFCLHHANGSWEWFETADMILGENNEITLLLHKITDDIQKDNALQKATLEAELALRGQSEFFAHISHELRTPLNAILGFAQMMHQGMFGEIANPRYSDYLQIMEHSGQELLGKINDLLEISSLCAGIDHLTEKNIPLPELIKAVIDTHARELFVRRIQVEADIAPLNIIGDRTKLQQALSHLVRNAIKFSPEDSIITLRSHHREDGSLALTLTDQGTGFSEEQLSHFHGRTQQFSFLERNRKLLGFGLPLAEELIRLHQGEVGCRNAHALGAEVTVTLPAERVIAVRPEHQFKPKARQRNMLPASLIPAPFPA